MGVRADIVGENAVPWKLVAQDVQNLVRRETCAIRTQGAIEQRSVLLPFLRRPIVGGWLDSANRFDRGVEIAGFVPKKFQPISRLGGFRVDVDDGNVPSPVLIIDLDRIITHGDDQIRPVRESLYVGAPRPADDTCPVRVIFRQKSFGVHRRRQKAIFAARRT